MDDIAFYKELLEEVSVLDTSNVETLHAHRVEQDFSTTEKMLAFLLSLSGLEDLNEYRLELIVEYKHILRRFGLPF